MTYFHSIQEVVAVAGKGKGEGEREGEGEGFLGSRKRNTLGRIRLPELEINDGSFSRLYATRKVYFFELPSQHEHCYYYKSKAPEKGS